MLSKYIYLDFYHKVFNIEETHFTSHRNFAFFKQELARNPFGKAINPTDYFILTLLYTSVPYLLETGSPMTIYDFNLTSRDQKEIDKIMGEKYINPFLRKHNIVTYKDIRVSKYPKAVKAFFKNVNPDIMLTTPKN